MAVLGEQIPEAMSALNITLKTSIVPATALNVPARGMIGMKDPNGKLKKAAALTNFAMLAVQVVKRFSQKAASVPTKTTAAVMDVITIPMEQYAWSEPILPTNAYPASGIAETNAVIHQTEVLLDQLKLAIINNVRM